jgi:DNA repair protein RecO (recombination protein O)
VPKSRAILLRKTPLTDTSLIVSWCCPELGLIKTVAKGARRPGSALAGQLDLFYEVEIEFATAKRGDLHHLREATARNYRHGLQASYLRVLAASYFVRLIELVAEPDTPIPTLHNLLERAIHWLCENEPTLNGLLHFEKELAKTLGLFSPDDPAPPIHALQEIYHNVPEQRQALMEKLR